MPLFFLAWPAVPPTSASVTKLFQKGNNYPALKYWLRWSGYSEAGHSIWRLNHDLRGTCSDCLWIPAMLVTTAEFFGPCMCPMWPFESNARGKRLWNASAACKAWKLGGFPFGSVQKNPNHFLFPVRLPSHFHPPFWLRAPTQHLLSLSRFTHSFAAFPSPQARSAASIPAAVLQKLVERLRQRSSAWFWALVSQARLG